MSIIHEAIKKAAQDSGKSDSLSEAVLSDRGISGRPKSKERELSSIAPRLKRTLMKREAVPSPKSFYVALTLSIFLLIGVGYFFKTYILVDNSESMTDEPALSTSVMPPVVEVTPVMNHAVQPLKPAGTRRKIPVRIPKIDVTGVMLENPPKALINGHIIEEGSKIDNVRVVNIHSDRIDFSYRGKRFSRIVD